MTDQFPQSQMVAAFKDLDARLTKYHDLRLAELRRTAEGFSVFDFIEPSENRLSDVLRFLLDPKESHGQGTAFLRAFAKRANLSIPDVPDDTLVVREAVTYSIKRNRRRIDVLVTVAGFALAIETKKFAGEQNQQIRDYCEHLKNVAERNSYLIFLTRTGEDASSIDADQAAELKQKGQLRCWSWDGDIVEWLKDCVSKGVPPKIQHFIEDFQGYIRDYLTIREELEAQA